MNLNKLIAARDIDGIVLFARENNLVLRDWKLIPRDEASMKSAKEKVVFWDQRQQSRKILKH